MYEIGGRLRESIDAQPLPQLPSGWLGDVHRAAARRRLARGLGFALVPLSLAGLGVAAAVLHQHSDGDARAKLETQVVPWVPLPASAPSTANSSSPSSAVALYSPCSGNQVAGRFDYANPSMGDGLLVLLSFKNTSTASCTLSTPASVFGNTDEGATVSPNPEVLDSSAFSLNSPANLEPGGSASLPLLVSDACSPDPSSRLRSIGVGLSEGRDVSVTLPDSEFIQFACGVSVGQFGTPGDASDAPRSPLNQLQAAVNFPSIVTVGKPVDFTVTLTNPAQHDIELTPCPNYTEFLVTPGVAPQTAARTYQLNCPDSATVHAGGSITFAMALPPPEKAGRIKYGWRLEGTAVTAGGASMAE